MIRRRDLVALIGTAATWPFASVAQQPQRDRHIGVLGTTSGIGAEGRAAFEDGLQLLGWKNGSNLHINYRLVEANREQMRIAAREMVALAPEVIQVQSTPLTDELLKLTRTIPIVFVHVSDPIGSGFVGSFAHPGGNVTGFTDIEQSLGGKWLQLLKETVPSMTHAALLFNPDTAPGHGDFFFEPFQAAAVYLGLTPLRAAVHDSSELEAAIAALAPEGGLVITPESFTGGHIAEIIGLAQRFRVPGVYPYRDWAATGGLLSYGTDRWDLYRRAASYVDRILKGDRPGDLPVQAPTKFELAVNVNTAKTLGLTVPPSVLARADEVIE